MPAKKGPIRMVVFDLMRGFFMMGITVNHIALFPNLLAFFTGATKLWVSLAEGFFMISGFFIGYLYRDKIKSGFDIVFKRLVLRSLRLYLWSVYLVFLFTYWGNMLPRNIPKTGLWIVTWQNLPELVFKTISLRYTYGWADLLPIYSVLLLASPIYLWFLNKGYWKTLLLINFGLWILRGQNIYLAIQVLFFGAVIFGFYLPKILRFWKSWGVKRQTIARKIVYMIFTSSLVACLVSVFFFGPMVANLPFGEYLIQKNRVLGLYFDKQTVGIGRLVLSPIWFLAGLFVVGRNKKYFETYFGWLLLPFGRNSLYAYILHAFVIFPIPFLVNYFKLSGFFWNTIVSTVAVGIVYLILIMSSESFKRRF